MYVSSLPEVLLLIRQCFRCLTLCAGLLLQGIGLPEATFVVRRPLPSQRRLDNPSRPLKRVCKMPLRRKRSCRDQDDHRLRFPLELQ